MGHRKFVCDPHCQVNWSWSWNASLGMYVRVREWIVVDSGGSSGQMS